MAFINDTPYSTQACTDCDWTVTVVSADSNTRELGKVLGALHLLKKHADTFTEDDRQTLQGLVDKALNGTPFTDEQIERIATTTMTLVSKDSTWSLN